MKPELQKPEPERSYQSSFWPELTNPNVRVFGTHEPEPDDAYVLCCYKCFKTEENKNKSKLGHFVYTKK